jgi:hypothetical protein
MLPFRGNVLPFRGGGSAGVNQQAPRGLEMALQVFRGWMAYELH